MTTMMATQIHDYGGSDVLRYEQTSRPEVQAGEVLIKVEAIGVNPVDWKLREGYVRQKIELPMPCKLGADVAGTIEAVGDGVSKFSVGDKVYSMIGLFGAYAEYVSVNAGFVAKSPNAMSVAEAASVPLAALTAWQGLFEQANLQAGQTLLVHGAAGGVGGFAVQFGKAKGAKVIATASAKNADYVKGLGADQVFDYRVDSADVYPADVDVVLDLIGGDSLMQLFDALKSGGDLVQVVPGGTPEAVKKAAELNVTAAGIQVHPDGQQLAEIAALIDAGKVNSDVAAEFSLADVAKAHDMSQAGHTRGKIVLSGR